MEKINHCDIQQIINQSENITIDLSSIAPFELKPRIETRHHGVYYIGIHTDKKTGEISETPAIKLCDELNVLGMGQDENKSAYIIIKYKNKFTRQTTTTAIKQAEIGTQQGWCTLQNMGIGIAQGKVNRERLSDFLQFTNRQTQFKICHTTGWKGDSYVMPSGNIITPENSQTPKMVYMGDTSKANEYTLSGSLKDWQDNIAKYAIGNSRMMLAIGTSLAAPLLRGLNMENGGFHLFGDSRDGKTTTAQIGASVWGSPESRSSWNATALAIINAAYSRNDNFMFLDEIGESKPYIVAQAAYSLGNGQNKGQSEKDKNQNRATIKFKTLFFSTGEKPLDTYIKQGNPSLWNAGQAVRLASIPSDVSKGYGAFDTLHHFATSWEFAEYLNQQTAQYYGTAGQAWINALQSDTNHIQTIQKHMSHFEQHLPHDLNGQIRTVAKRFALVYAAIELASEYGITGFQAACGFNPLRECFTAWLERHGTQKSEDETIIENMQDFLSLYAMSERFADPKNIDHLIHGYHATGTRHAGFREMVDGNAVLWIVPFVFRKEIAKGFEVKKVVDVLAEYGLLEKGKNKAQYGTHQSTRLKGRYYKSNSFIAATFSDNDG